MPALHLTVAGASRSVLVSDDTEFFGAYEVFGTGDYDVDSSEGVFRVLDLGANVGFASMLFAERYPRAEIVAVEVAPDTFARLSRNLACFPNVRPMLTAVGVDGPHQLDLGAPSAERRVGARGVVVPGVSLTTLLTQLGWAVVDLLKIDVEGAEFAIFADTAVTHVRLIVGEVHPQHAPRGYTSVASCLPAHRVEESRSAQGLATMFRAVRHESSITPNLASESHA